MFAKEKLCTKNTTIIEIYVCIMYVKYMSNDLECLSTEQLLRTFEVLVEKVG